MELTSFVFSFRPGYIVAAPPASLQAAAAAAGSIASNHIHQQQHPQEFASIRPDSTTLQQNMSISSHSPVVQAVAPAVVTTNALPSAVPTSLLSPNGLIPFPLAAATANHQIQPAAVVVATTDQIPTTAAAAPFTPTMLAATQFPQSAMFATQPNAQYVVPSMEQLKMKEGLVRQQMYFLSIFYHNNL